MNLPFKMITETEMEKYRAETFWTKEPETLEWIRNMGPGYFIDIGANIGVYSLYAASLEPTRIIVAIEPLRQNFKRLVENVWINRFSNIIPFKWAVGDRTKRLELFVKDKEIGSSGSQTETAIDEYGNPYKPVEKQKLLMISLAELDSICFSPRYLKIDVDGHEKEILQRIDKFKCESILVEVNKESTPIDDLINHMKANGYERDSYYDNFQPHSSERRGGNPENIVFRRANV